MNLNLRFYQFRYVSNGTRSKCRVPGIVLRAGNVVVVP
jgi:hypothetical protein